MKSAEEWANLSDDQYREICGDRWPSGDDAEVKDLIRAIQADAIRAAAEKCAPDRKDRDFVPGSFWERLEAEQHSRILKLLPEASK